MRYSKYFTGTFACCRLGRRGNKQMRGVCGCACVAKVALRGFVVGGKEEVRDSAMRWAAGVASPSWRTHVRCDFLTMLEAHRARCEIGDDCSS